MEFRVLGPLAASAEGSPVPLGGPRQRALLAYLLLHANEVVSADRLVDEIWFELPAHGAAALQTQVSRLRKAVGDRLISTGRGYSLRVEGDELDLHRLRSRLAEAGAAATAAERAQILRDADALWTGDPLGDVEAPFVAAEAAALDELRIGAIEERIEADLECGRDAELLSELSLLVAQHPLRERLRTQQILALYRAGRQAEALEAYRAARAKLDEELGLEPSPALRDLERAVLRQDPELLLPAAPRAPVAPVSRRRRRTVGAALVAAALAGVAAAVVAAHHHSPRAQVVAEQSPHVRRSKPAAPVTPTAVVVRRVATPTVRKRPATHRASTIARHAARPHPRRTQTTTSISKTVRTPTPAPKAKPTERTTTQPQAPSSKKPAHITDAFKGSAIDPTIWYESASGTGWNVAERNGALEWTFAADAKPGGQWNSIGGHLGSQCKFPADFDARVDFSLPEWPSGNGIIVNLWAFFADVGYASWRRSDAQYGDGYGSFTGPGGSANIPLPETSGSLRIARRDGVITTYFWHNGAWDPLTSTEKRGPATIAIGAGTQGPIFGGQPVVVDLRNFSVTGDAPVCPPGSAP